LWTLKLRSGNAILSGGVAPLVWHISNMTRGEDSSETRRVMAYAGD